MIETTGDIEGQDEGSVVYRAFLHDTALEGIMALVETGGQELAPVVTATCVARDDPDARPDERWMIWHQHDESCLMIGPLTASARLVADMVRADPEVCCMPHWSYEQEWTPRYVIRIKWSAMGAPDGGH